MTGGRAGRWGRGVPNISYDAPQRGRQDGVRTAASLTGPSPAWRGAEQPEVV